MHFPNWRILSATFALLFIAALFPAEASARQYRHGWRSAHHAHHVRHARVHRYRHARVRGPRAEPQLDRTMTASVGPEAMAGRDDSPWATAQYNVGSTSVVSTRGRSYPVDIRTSSQIVAEAAQYVGMRNPMRFRGPGCKAFVNMVARRAGYYSNRSMRAFDAAGMGQRIAYPVPGAYRVSARRGGGHVDIVAAVHGNTVTTINGNKGGNRVGWSRRGVAGARYYLPIRG